MDPLSATTAVQSSGAAASVTPTSPQATKDNALKFAQQLALATQMSAVQMNASLLDDPDSDSDSDSSDMSDLIGSSGTGSSSSTSGNSGLTGSSKLGSMFAANPVLMALDAQLGIDPMTGTSTSTAGTSTGATGGTAISGSTLNAAVTSGGTSQPVLSNVATVAKAAMAAGVDPTTAVATMLVESGGANTAIGDGGTSFGLFQLHQGGMLGSLSSAQAMDPSTNAAVAMSSLASTARSMRGATPGAIAAASQRPADQAGYATKVNAMLGQAGQLLTQAAQQGLMSGSDQTG